MKFDNKIDAGHGWVGQILYRNGVRSMTAILNGGGDSGDLDEITYVGEDGKMLSAPEIEEDILGAVQTHTPEGSVSAYETLRQIIVEEAVDEGNWYDNEGGSVESEYIVEENGFSTEYIYITYHGPDDDDWDFDDDDEYEDAPAP